MSLIVCFYWSGWMMPERGAADKDELKASLKVLTDQGDEHWL